MTRSTVVVNPSGNRLPGMRFRQFAQTRQQFGVAAGERDQLQFVRGAQQSRGELIERAHAGAAGHHAHRETCRAPAQLQGAFARDPARLKTAASPEFP